MEELHYGDTTGKTAAVNFLDSPPWEPARERSVKKRLAIWAFVFLCGILFIRSALRIFAPARASGNPLAYDPITLEPKPPDGFFSKIAQAVFVPETTLEGQKDDRINLLLMGIGGPGHDGPYLTDTMILVSIKPSTHQVAMVSIPRDLYVTIPGKGMWKLNHASAFGELEKPNWGGAKATEVIEKTFDIHIPYYARVDFNAFKEIIDAVGGITVAVDRSFVDTAYPDENNNYKTVAFTAGPQTMDGNTALQYARSRHGSNGEGSDFARSKRQQKMLLALKEKIMSSNGLTNPILIHSITASLDTHMTTNMSFADMMAFLRFARGLHVETINTISLDTGESGYLESKTGPEGAFILVPKSGEFGDIHRAVTGIFDPTPAANIVLQPNDTPPQRRAPSAAAPTIEIQNGTWRAGLAARVKKRLAEKGIQTETMGNAGARPVAKSGIAILSPETHPDIVRALQETLQIPLKEKIENGVLPTKGTDILVILGEDFHE